MPTHFHNPTHPTRSLPLCLWVFVLGAFVGSGGMSWYWHGTVSAGNDLVVATKEDVGDSRDLSDACFSTLEELWVKIRLGREIEARRATPAGR